MSMEKKHDPEALLELRRQGMSFKEIGQTLGLSKQRVWAILRCYGAVEDGRSRKDSVDIEKIRFQGIYDMFAKDRSLTFSKIGRIIAGRNDKYSRATAERFHGFVIGERQNSSFTFFQLKKLIELSGMTFEELFKEREI